MTIDEQRIAIAEACGWQRGEPRWNYDKIVNARFQGVEHLPNYLNDLNAMHNAERFLRPPIWKVWDLWEEFCRIIEDDPHATASVRAEAFLRALGTWKGASLQTKL